MSVKGKVDGVVTGAGRRWFEARPLHFQRTAHGLGKQRKVGTPEGTARDPRRWASSASVGSPRVRQGWDRENAPQKLPGARGGERGRDRPGSPTARRVRSWSARGGGAGCAALPVGLGALRGLAEPAPAAEPPWARRARASAPHESRLGARWAGRERGRGPEREGGRPSRLGGAYGPGRGEPVSRPVSWARARWLLACEAPGLALPGPGAPLAVCPR